MSPTPLRLHALARLLLAILLAGACGPGALEPVAYRLSVVEGDHQVDSVLAVLPIPFRVQVKDDRNQPVAGVEVRWNSVIAGGTLSSPTSLTDAHGNASVTYALGSRTGSYYVAASAMGVSGASAWFEVTAEPGAAVHIHPSFGGGAIDVGGTTQDPYGVQVTDDHGNPVSGVAVDWLVTEGGGSVHPVQSVTTTLHATTRHTLGSQDGRQTALAVARGLPGSPQVAFAATAVTAMVTMSGPSAIACFLEDACGPYFAPGVVTISTGQSVGWTFSGQLPCNVVFEDDPIAPVSSTTTRSTGRHSRTFTVPGTYRYRCTLHSTDFLAGMVGVVVVQ